MFDDIVGNKKIKKLLTTTLENKKIPHSYLFVGPEGIGKKLIATEFSKKILNSNEIINNPDFTLIEPDGNTIKISQIRKMQIKVQEKPIVSEKKIYIIDNADKMTIEAQNCLLKTLEEPPEFVTIILIGTNENEFLSTIKSRCMILRFEQISDEEMKSFLKRQYQINVTDVMLQMFQGSIKKAIELKDNSEIYEKINTILENISKRDLLETIDEAEILYQSKEEIQKILEYINTILLKKSKTNYQYANCISIVEDAKKRLKQNGNYDMCIDNMLWNIWREVN